VIFQVGGVGCAVNNPISKTMYATKSNDGCQVNNLEKQLWKDYESNVIYFAI
jgi:hypothetical protein